MNNYQQYVTADITESQYEKFTFLKTQFTEKLKKWNLFSQVLEERTRIEDQYTKKIEDFLQRLQDFTFEGAFAVLVTALKTTDEKRVTLSKKITTSLKSNVIDAGKVLMTSIKNEMSDFSGQKRELTRELQVRLESLGKLKSEYASYTSDCNLVGLEYECLKLQRGVTKEKKTQFYLKYQKLIDMLSHSEEKYLSQIVEYNHFVDKIENCMAGFNTKILDAETKRIKFIQDSFFNVWNESKEDIANFPNYFLNSTITQTLSKIDTDSEVQSLLKGFVTFQGFPSKIEDAKLKTFIREGLQEVNMIFDMHEENILTEFRKFYCELIQSETLSRSKSFEMDGVTNEEKDDLNFLAHFLNESWRGESMSSDNYQKFAKCLEHQICVKAFIGAIQQYRHIGKFVIGDDGYNNIAMLLICTLKQLLNSKDAHSVKKLMILSFTFWKEIKKDNNKERKYLQSEISWHPTWKELDFWIAAIFLSIHEEITKQDALNLRECETQKESLEREQNTAFGQLLNFGHNMIAFMIKTEDAKNVINQFCRFFSFKDIQVQKVMEFAAKEPEKIEVIFDYFAPKKPKEVPPNPENDDVINNVKAFLKTIKGNPNIEFSSKEMELTKNSYYHKRRTDLEFILNVAEGQSITDSVGTPELPESDN